MSQYVVTDTELTAVANAIRAKLGSSDSLEWPSDFVDAIDDISGGGGSVNVIENIIPLMASNVSPSGVASASSSLNSTFDAFKAFDKAHAQSSMQGGWLANAGDYAPYIQYEFDSEYQLYGIKIWTANNGTTATRVVTIEGRQNGIWENALKSGSNVTLSFVQGTYGSTEQEHDILLNENIYDAIRITGNERFYLGTNQTACTFAEIEVYAYKEIISHSDW